MKIGEKVDFLVLNFIRTYINPQLTYTSKFYQDCIDKFVRTSIEVFINGVVMYFFLSSAIFLFPPSSTFIFLGSAYWHIPLAIIYLGIFSIVLRGLYRYFRVDYKNKGGN